MSLKSLKNELERLRKKSNTQRVQPSDPIVKNLLNGQELIGLSIPDAIDKICEWVDSIESDRPEYQPPEM
ncbi:MAG TPA: hypothetical protein VK982_02490 [Bacteroidales bacterium]|nr:hypothetical protein [Bacteroidales bacterium]